MEQLNEEYLSYLMNLLNKGNIKLSYIVLWILINISYIEYSDVLFKRNLGTIYQISSFLENNKNNKKLTYRGLLLLKNITLNNISGKEILL